MNDCFAQRMVDNNVNNGRATDLNFIEILIFQSLNQLQQIQHQVVIGRLLQSRYCIPANDIGISGNIQTTWQSLLPSDSRMSECWTEQL